jgi:hypothetical protein
MQFSQVEVVSDDSPALGLRNGLTAVDSLGLLKTLQQLTPQFCWTVPHWGFCMVALPPLGPQAAMTSFEMQVEEAMFPQCLLHSVG